VKQRHFGTEFTGEAQRVFQTFLGCRREVGWREHFLIAIGACPLLLSLLTRVCNFFASVAGIISAFTAALWRERRRSASRRLLRMCAFFAQIIKKGSAISAQLKPNRGKLIRGRDLSFLHKGKDYELRDRVCHQYRNWALRVYYSAMP
jgi:hypothetical protein